jgi:hypothetical protein
MAVRRTYIDLRFYAEEITQQVLPQGKSPDIQGTSLATSNHGNLGVRGLPQYVPRLGQVPIMCLREEKGIVSETPLHLNHSP